MILPRRAAAEPYLGALSAQVTLDGKMTGHEKSLYGRLTEKVLPL
jgi:hypothetical protein